MRRTILTGIFTLMISFAFVSGVMAQQKPAATPAPASKPYIWGMFSGTVEKIDSAKKEVVVKQGKEEMTFSLSDKAKVTESKKELSFNDLKKGENVSIEYTKEGSNLTAESISLSPMRTSQLAPSQKSDSKTEKGW